MSRVLATDTAKSSIRQMRSIITGPLIEQIEALNREGQTLSQADVWDGRLASQFRGSWPDTYQALRRAQQQLEELRTSIDQITDDILRAGGNL